MQQDTAKVKRAERIAEAVRNAKHAAETAKEAAETAKKAEKSVGAVDI